MDGIDRALAGLEGLEQLEVVDHVARFDIVHAALTDALSSAEDGAHYASPARSVRPGAGVPQDIDKV